jgi:hypothetical protein
MDAFESLVAHIHADDIKAMTDMSEEEKKKYREEVLEPKIKAIMSGPPISSTMGWILY